MSTRARVGILIVVLVLATVMPASIAGAAGGANLTVNVTALNVRSGPGTSFAIIGAVHSGDSLPITGRNAAASWYQVSLASGKTGWVSSSYVQASGDLAALPVVQSTASAASAGAQTGATIVFQTSSGGAIYAVKPDGSNLRYLTTGMDPALSPDGRQVAFTRWDGTGNGVTGSLWVINVDGSGERQVHAGADQPKSPTWSADGKQIVISMQQGGTISDTWLCVVNGKRVEVQQEVAGGRCMRQRANPNWRLRLVEVATGQYQDLMDSAHSFAPTWDPINAWHVVYRGDEGLVNLDLNRQAIWTLKADGAQRGPVFSPDGTKIATTFNQNDHWEVHVMNADGSGEVRLTQTPQYVITEAHLKDQVARQWNNAAPAWSPDGSQIAFVTDRSGVYEIWIMNADGTAQHPLLPSETMAKLNLWYDGMDERVISWR